MVHKKCSEIYKELKNKKNGDLPFKKIEFYISPPFLGPPCIKVFI